MERLAEKLEDDLKELITCINEIQQERIDRAISRLKSYEDAEEQGLLVRLPCKVGDTVWRICGRRGKKFVAERTVLSVTMYEPEEFEIFTNCTDWLGKTVFLTREEAEKALKEANRNG